MADLLTFEALFPDQDEATILARWRAWANEGRDPTDVDQWTDTREGSHWWIMTTPGRREAARIYDVMGTEVPASVLPQFAWGVYLDAQAELRGLRRLVATRASGVVKFSGPDGTVISAGVTVGVEQTDPAGETPEYAVTTGGVVGDVVTGIVELPVEAVEEGAAGNVAAGAVVAPITPLDDVTAITNDDPIVGGTDAEADPALALRILGTFEGAAVANQRYYKQFAENWPGVGRATVIPAADGPGTLTIILSTADGQPVAAGVVTALQDALDPDPGLGEGEGQVGATITVESSTVFNVDVIATVEFDPGYSWDGAGGTIAVQGPVETAVNDYIKSLESGEEVVYRKVVGRFIGVLGVHDITGLTLNSSGVNVTTVPPQVAILTLPITVP